ncbi:MAG: ABC transporter permease [Halanaerobiales bacterium]
MKFLWNIAGKNLFRNKLRTSVSIIAIAISVAVVIFTRGMIEGFIGNSFSLYIKYDTGHIKIVDQEYRLKERLLSLAYPVDGFNSEGVSPMIEELEQLDGIEIAVPRIKFGAMASINEDMVTMLGWGVDPEKENQFTNLSDKIIEGDMIQSGEMAILVGQGLLNKLKADVGDKVTMVFNNSFNSFKGATFRIAGVIESEMPLMSNKVFYLPLDTAQRLLIMQDQATEVLLVTPNASQASQYFPDVKQLFEAEGALDRYSVTLWENANAMIEYLQVGIKIYNFIYIFLILLSSIVVINTMIMIVKERTQEIGMMTALGLKSSEILRLFVIEGTIMGIIGSFLGSILGGIILKVTSIYGLSYGQEAFEAMGEDLMMNPVIYPSFAYEHIIYGFILGIIITSLTCIYPAKKASNMEPTEALRDI